MIFAEKWNTTPFDVLAQDIDDFILVANTMIARSNNDGKKTKGAAKKKEKRIRVNDKTATGGWW